MPDDEADIFVPSINIIYFKRLFKRLIICFKRFFLKHKGLSAGKVALLTKKEYGSAVYFYKFS